MSFILFVIILSLIPLGALGVLLYIKLPRRIKLEKFGADWKDLQGFCKDKSTWPQAIKEADQLLESALKKKKFKGHSMGEKLVAAQRIFSNNDSVWYAHNLNKKLSAKPSMRLNEKDVRDALVAFRQALKDLGALPNAEGKNAK